MWCSSITTPQALARWSQHKDRKPLPCVTPQTEKREETQAVQAPRLSGFFSNVKNFGSIFRFRRVIVSQRVRHKWDPRFVLFLIHLREENKRAENTGLDFEVLLKPISWHLSLQLNGYNFMLEIIPFHWYSLVQPSASFVFINLQPQQKKHWYLKMH